MNGISQPLSYGPLFHIINQYARSRIFQFLNFVTYNTHAGLVNVKKTIPSNPSTRAPSPNAII